VTESVYHENFVNTISKTNEGNFTQFWSQMYLGFVGSLITFWDQRSKIKVTADNEAKTR